MRTPPLYRGEAHSVAEQVLRDVFIGLRDELITDMAAANAFTYEQLAMFAARAKVLEQGMDRVRRLVAEMKKDTPKP